MRASQLITIAVAAMLLVGGVAALGAASATDRATNDSTDADEHAPDDAGAVPAASDDRENADGVGPSDGLPAQVPDHVSDVHDRIDAFLDGSIDDLGQSLSDLLGAGGDDDQNEVGNEDVDGDEGDEDEDAAVDA